MTGEPRDAWGGLGGRDRRRGVSQRSLVFKLISMPFKESTLGNAR